MFINKSILFVVLAGLVISCDKSKSEELLVNESTVPAYFPEAVYAFPENKVINAEATFELGRKLFYDPVLSIDGEVSCGSCHKQYAAFADPTHVVPHGVHGLFGKRNSPGIFNTRWIPSFMWDGGINHIEVMPIAPITNPVEMGEDLGRVVDKLRQSDKYPPLFKQAFGSDSITSQFMLLAFAKFMSEMVSGSSRYDDYKTGKLQLATDEQSGLNLFKSHCSGCHAGELFTDFQYRNNGLDSSFKDVGRYAITTNNLDSGKFRTPTLRNIAITQPYMHDGRFSSLEAVVNHYRFGIKKSSTLDKSLEGKIPLTEQEAKQLVSFLKTLTDYKFITNKRFSEPK